MPPVDVIFDGVSAVLGVVPRDRTYVLARSIAANNVTIGAGVIVCARKR